MAGLSSFSPPPEARDSCRGVALTVRLGERLRLIPSLDLGATSSEESLLILARAEAGLARPLSLSMSSSQLPATAVPPHRYWLLHTTQNTKHHSQKRWEGAAGN